MTTKVSTSASPVRTAFGGSDDAPSAERTSESTTAIRTNDVVMTKRKRRDREERQRAQDFQRQARARRMRQRRGGIQVRPPAARDHVGNSYAEAIVDRDDFAVRDQTVVDEDVDRRPGRAVEPHDRARSEFQQFAQP